MHTKPVGIHSNFRLFGQMRNTGRSAIRNEHLKKAVLSRVIKGRL